jgi:hypothetical protein
METDSAEVEETVSNTWINERSFFGGIFMSSSERSIENITA